MIEREPQFVIAPQVKPAPNRRDRRKAGRQHSPRQPPTQQIQDRLDDPSQRPFARTAYVGGWRSEAHTSELPSLMRTSYAVFCLQKTSIHICHSNASDTHLLLRLLQCTTNSTHHT